MYLEVWFVYHAHVSCTALLYRLMYFIWIGYASQCVIVNVNLAFWNNLKQPKYGPCMVTSLYMLATHKRKYILCYAICISRNISRGIWHDISGCGYMEGEERGPRQLGVGSDYTQWFVCVLIIFREIGMFASFSSWGMAPYWGGRLGYT